MKIIQSASYKKSGYEVLPNIDEEKNPKRPGLEGPIRLRSGKIVYYDPREGKYYDASTDMYMEYEDYISHNAERPNPHRLPKS
jgi:hypothetical protein